MLMMTIRIMVLMMKMKTDDNGDGIQDSDEEQTGDSDEEETRFDDVAEEEEFPEIRFSGLQFQNNPSQLYWIVPGVELGGH